LQRERCNELPGSATLRGDYKCLVQSKDFVSVLIRIQ
jgi:hypothetical protein